MGKIKKGLMMLLCIGMFVILPASCYAAEEPGKNGLIRETEGYRYYEDGKAVKNQWKRPEKNGRKYYFGPDGVAVVGSRKIDGIYFVFDDEGRLLEPPKTKFVKTKSGTYYVNAKGNPVKGWQIVKGKLYYISKTGLRKTNAKYDGITLGKNGVAKDSTASRLKMKTMEVVADVTAPGMTKKQKLRACFKYTISSAFRYDRRKKWPNVKKKGWQQKCALDMLTTHRGVCFGYACAFAALAKELSYTPYLIDANLHSRHCFVRINGKYYDKYTNIFGAKKYPRSHKVLGVTKF